MTGRNIPEYWPYFLTKKKFALKFIFGLVLTIFTFIYIFHKVWLYYTKNSKSLNLLLLYNLPKIIKPCVTRNQTMCSFTLTGHFIWTHKKIIRQSRLCVWVLAVGSNRFTCYKTVFSWSSLSDYCPRIVLIFLF